MTGLYSPFDAHPGQQWSNLIRPRHSTQTDTAGERLAFPALPADQSPQPVVTVSIVRCRIGAHHFSIPAKPQAKAAPRQGNSAGSLRTLIGSRDFLPLFSNAGPSGRTQIFGAVYRLLRAFSSLLNSFQEPSSGLSKRFQMFLRFVVHTEQHTEESEGNVPKSTGEIRNVEC